MKHWHFIIVLLVQLSFSQKEANIWYFGNQAGLDFNSGSPVALIDNALPLKDYGNGRASIADSDGNLLFYSDGQRILNKNHELMLNGVLFEDLFLSEANRIIIIPKPDSSTIYYMFYTGYYRTPIDARPFGLLYSEIDMSLDNGLGGVTASKNISVNPKTNSLSATVHANGQDIWLVTYDNLNGTFYSYLVTNSGVNGTPIPSNTGLSSDYYWNVTIKLAPNGKKLVLMDSMSAFLHEFNNTNGIVSNNPLKIGDGEFAGNLSFAEFSSTGNLLYISTQGRSFGGGSLYQYDLNAIDISNSKTLLSYDTIYGFGDIQIGTDQKIYVSNLGSNYISVINSPEILGLGCDFVIDGVYLNGRTCTTALPHFIQSYFYLSIQTDNVCLGEPTQFHFNSSNTYDSMLWDFGDGTTSIEETPIHTYTSPGDYTVTLTSTSGAQTTSDTKTITIYEVPTANKPEDLIICNPKSYDSGFYNFNLVALKSDILNGQDPSIHEVKFYASMSDYTNHLAIENPENYTNGDEYNLHTIIAVVKNIYSQCESMTSFNLQVFDLPDTSQSIYDFSLCDDTSVGTDNDGFIEIDLAQKEVDILNGLPASDFGFSYYTDAALQNQIVDPNAYHNDSSSETIYVLITNLNNPACSVVTSFNLEVYASPTVAPSVILKQCDDDLDGFSAFNLNEVLAEISPNYMSETITFHETLEDADASIPIDNAYTYTNQAVSTDVVYARVENGNGCFKTSLVNLIVATTQIPTTFMRDFYACDLNDNGEAPFDFSSVSTEIEALFPSGQELVVSYYRNLANALEETNPIDDISNYTNIGYPYAQQIYVRVDSKLDNDCIGLGAHISLHVDPLPGFTIDSPQIVCSSDPTFTVVLDPIESDTQEVFNYLWVYQDGTVLAHTPTLTVSTPGAYAVTLTKTDGSNCSRTREIFVNASELATITMDNITVVDVSSNNTVTINTSNLGLGDYEFALDDGFSSYQDEPIFEHVAPGIHTLFVRDKKGCGTSSIDISIIGFPKFFTPNGDGNNDTWQINGVNGQFQPNSDIYIYDRYGKVLKQLVATTNGWDGTFNGTLLPSDDYWFSVSLQDGRTFKGHFSLKR